MSEAVQRYFLPGSRQRIYLIGVFGSLIIMFLSVWRVGPVVVEAKDTFGLVSHLPLGYWMGLALLLVISIFAFLDRELKKDAIYLAILIALGLFLLGITVFVYENAVTPDSYYPTAEVKNLLITHHLDINHPPILSSYYSWPAIHFISASLMEITGLDLYPFLKYASLLWIPCFVFVTYGIGKRFKLEPNRCFLLSFLAISSWLINFAGYYYARFPAMILFLLIFMLLLVPRRTPAENIAVVLMFTALVITHGLTAVAVLLALTLLAIYRKNPISMLLFIVIFGVWYIYQATGALDIGIDAFKKPLKDIFSLVEGGRYQVSASTSRLVTRYSELSYLAAYAALMIGSAVLLLRRKIKEEHRKLIIALFCWAIGVALIVFWGHGEASFRTFIYCIVPALCIVVLSFSNTKLLIPLMCLFVVLSPLFSYAGQAGWGQVLTTELKGTKFFALEVKPKSSYLYGPGGQLIFYYDPGMVSSPHLDPLSTANVTRLGDVDLSVLDKLQYVIISKQETSWQEFTWNEAPYASWPQTEGGKKANLLYDNGDFQIYENHL